MDHRGCCGTDSYQYEQSQFRLSKLIDPAGNETVWEYDTGGDPVKITDAAGGERTAVYDQYGLMTSMTDETNNITVYAHNVFGKVLTRTDADGTTNRFLRDRAGRISTMTRASIAAGDRFALRRDRNERPTILSALPPDNV